MNIILSGATGRMGKEIQAAVKKTKKHKIVGTLGREGRVSKSKFKADVIIDFSQPECLENVIQLAVTNKTPLLIGTTGLGKAHLNKIAVAAKKIPVLLSPNTSIGIQLFRLFLNNLPIMKGAKIQIEETHHINKKDAPSGTAIYLKNHIEKVINRKMPPIISHRQGDVFGVHEVIIQTPEEIIRIKHEALNRAVFAKGAIEAASWLVKQKRKKLYSMEDFVNG